MLRNITKETNKQAESQQYYPKQNDAKIKSTILMNKLEERLRELERFISEGGLVFKNEDEIRKWVAFNEESLKDGDELCTINPHEPKFIYKDGILTKIESVSEREFSSTKVFKNLVELKEYLNDKTKPKQLGDTLILETINLPDFWYTGFENDEYTHDGITVNKVQILETDKTELSDYVKMENGTIPMDKIPREIRENLNSLVLHGRIDLSTVPPRIYPSTGSTISDLNSSIVRTGFFWVVDGGGMFDGEKYKKGDWLLREHQNWTKISFNIDDERNYLENFTSSSIALSDRMSKLEKIADNIIGTETAKVIFGILGIKLIENSLKIVHDGPSFSIFLPSNCMNGSNAKISILLHDDPKVIVLVKHKKWEITFSSDPLLDLSIFEVGDNFQFQLKWNGSGNDLSFISIDDSILERS